MGEREWGRAPLPLHTVDGKGRILAVNRAWERLTGYSADEMLGHHMSEVVPQEYHSEFGRRFAQLIEEGELDGIECLIERRDASRLNVRVYSQFDADTATAECQLVDVTDHKRAEHDLTSSEARYRGLFELEPTPIIIHDGVSVLVANLACVKFLGYDSVEELVGRSVVEIVHPDDRSAVTRRVKRMMASDWTAPAVTERYIRKDGSFVSAETLASPVELDGRRVIHVVGIDLSERIAAEEALAESEARYRALFELSGDAILVHDARAVHFANRSAFECFRIPKDSDMSGLTVLDLVHPDSRELVASRMASILSGESEGRPTEFRLLRADGSDWFAEAYGAKLTIEGVDVIQTTLRDLTDRKGAENELAGYREQLERLLAERTESLERTRQELDAVTAVVSRTVEMRDPYTAGHQRRVAILAIEIARELGMDETDIEYLDVAAALHDVGKVSVPAEILSRPSRLSALEFELVKTHVEAGYTIVSSANLPGPVAEIVYQHHERLDGSGYPRGLKAPDLLVGSRVLAVADVVEAMCSHRPYRPSFGLAAAMEEIDAGSGTLFDAQVVEACRAVVHGGFVFTDEF